ncbi:Ficolin-1 [Holothuria leucospilota]|uniref:Ficolin-1 n=1 Tax=Holothuria leucospilota TaxID=206669 RepID=A0A9Q1H3J1_HOLLE|nr:Ficolin-1 [Holothuria leucospilota]
MYQLVHVYKGVLLHLSTCLLITEVTSTEGGSSYFFYQQPEYPRDCKEARDQCASDNFSGVYTIKPDGYLKPFEVYCDNDFSSGGWTVIQRRTDVSLTFQRVWEDYKSGFGFLGSEFWIGHDKLSYLTNQAAYELRIDLMFSNGSFFYITYKSFRISDEWSDYAIVSADEFRSNWSCIISLCPQDTTRDSCACQNLCTDPIGQTDCYTTCAEICEPKGCLVPETNSFIANGESVINAECTRNCTCVDNQLLCNTDYECSADASCKVKDETRKCYCNEGFEGDGETCNSIFRDCYEVYQAGHMTDGIYTIMPTDWPGTSFNVFCNMSFGDGGWTVFQRRIDGVTDFYRDWAEYKDGFGTLNQGNDFWLGNEKLHYLTDQKDYILRVDVVHSSDRLYYEEYRTLKIGDESTKYRLSYVSGNSRNTNDYWLKYNNGAQFSTRDQDNDGCSYHDCAEGHKGGWWYSTAVYTNWCTECYYSYRYCYYFQTRTSCNNLCTASNLNGRSNGGNGENLIYWTSSGNDCNHKFAEMKIRPIS